MVSFKEVLEFSGLGGLPLRRIFSGMWTIRQIIMNQYDAVVYVVWIMYVHIYEKDQKYKELRKVWLICLISDLVNWSQVLI